MTVALHIDKLTNSYYQILLGAEKVDNIIDECGGLDIKDILPGVKYLKTNCSKRYYDIKYKMDDKYDIYVENNNYIGIIGFLNIGYINDNEEIRYSTTSKFIRNFIKALKDLSTNEDFEFKHISIDNNEQKLIITSHPTDISDIYLHNRNCQKYNIILYVKTDLDFGTIYNLIKYDCHYMFAEDKNNCYYINTFYNKKADKHKIYFNSNFKNLLYTDEILSYTDFDNYNLIANIKANLENIDIDEHNVKIFEKIKKICECQIEKYKDIKLKKIKDKIKSKLELIDDIDTLEEILNLSTEFDE